jgi:D-sedoheptulose 7-phosphate isomerase
VSAAVNLLNSYIQTLAARLQETQVTNLAGTAIASETAILEAGKLARATHASGNKLMFIGNGGSAGICSHMATDYSKNGGMRSLAFNDGAFLTCLGNDYGYEHVFAKQIEFHGRAGDLLIAISSSGKSPNILKAVEAARQCKASVITLSGFGADNPLRKAGDLNFYLADGNYGFVEVGHLTLLHAVLDIAMGWKPEPASA